MSFWQMSDWKELPTCCDAPRCRLKRLLIVWAMARSRVLPGRLRRDSIRARQSIAGSSTSFQRPADLGDRVRLTDIYSSNLRPGQYQFLDEPRKQGIDTVVHEAHCPLR